MTLPSSVRTALAAWLASVLAAATVFPLVQGQGWFVDVALIAALTGGAGLAVRRVTTSAPAVVAVQLLVWVVAVCMIFLNRSAWLGVLPGPDAIAGGQTASLGLDPREGHQSMAAFIAATSRGDIPTGSIEYGTIFAVGLTLFVMTLALNALSIRLVRRFRQVYE